MVVVLMAMALVAMIASTMVLLGSNNLIYSHSTIEGLQASMAAEAGVQHAARRVCQPGGYSGTLTGTLPGGANYTVTVVGPGGTHPNLKDNTGTVAPIAPDHWYLEAVGETPNGTRRTTGWYVQKANVTSSIAAFAAEKLHMGKRAVTDTWDSTAGDGTYLGTRIANAGTASIGTNSSKKDSVTFDNNAYVDNYGSTVGTADVFVGPNPEAGVIKDAVAGTNYRMQKTLTSQKDLPPVDFSGEGTSRGAIENDAAYLANSTLVGGLLELNPGTYDEIKLNQTIYPLVLKPGGVYYFKKIEMGTGDLIILPAGATQTATVRIHDGLSLGSTVLINNLAHKPNLLRIESDGDIDIESGSEAYAVLYAPEKKITLKKGPGDPDFYGAITGKEVKLEDDASLHFDKALSSPSTTEAGTVTVVSARHF